MNDFIYLASQSPRRSQLLNQLGIRHELLLPGPEEDSEGLEVAIKNEAPLAYVKRVTGLKCDMALLRMQQRGLPPAPILCSDTTVALGRMMYGKPADASDAVRMLGELSGRQHRVLTAVAIQYGEQRLQALSDARVTFAPISALDIQHYVATGEPMGKAGAYAVQGRAAGFISDIRGSYSGIMGLPLFQTAQVLRAIGFQF